jgi:hypothetical protein
MLQPVFDESDPRNTLTPDAPLLSMVPFLPVRSPLPQSLQSAAAGDVSYTTPVFVADNIPIRASDLVISEVPQAPIISGLVDGVPVAGITADANRVPINDAAVAVTATSNGSSSTDIASAVSNTPAAVTAAAAPITALVDAVAAPITANLSTYLWYVVIAFAIWYAWKHWGKVKGAAHKISK